jgi:hypothetical protein
VAYHDCLSRNRLGFEFRPGRPLAIFLFLQSLFFSLSRVLIS